MQNGPDENKDIDISDFVDISEQIEQDQRIQDLIKMVSTELGTLDSENLPSSNEGIADFIITKLVQKLDQNNPEVSFEQLIGPIRNSILAELKANELNVPQLKEGAESTDGVAFERAKLAGKIALGLAVGAATIWFAGPACAIAGRSIFTATYTALYGTPGWANYLMVFLPGREWAGHLAFTYGPSMLSAPATYVGAKVGDGVEYVVKGAAGLATNALSGAAAYAMSMFYSKKPVENAQKAITDKSEKSDTPTPKPK